MKKLAFALTAALLLAAPALAQTNTPPILDGAAIIGPPPAPLSADQAADTLAMRARVSDERLAQARADQPFSPWVAMRPVLGDGFTEARLPRTKRVFDLVLNGLSPGIGAGKDAYARRRPFVEDSRMLQCDHPGQSGAESPSYPSGHGAGGWAWALVLAELIPSRADAILQRGRDYGDSRVICGFHYPSDIEASRILAAASIARLHADASFRRELDAARRELARAYPAH
jgi:acid phosphatase (class A)